MNVQDYTGRTAKAVFFKKSFRIYDRTFKMVDTSSKDDEGEVHESWNVFEKGSEECICFVSKSPWEARYWAADPHDMDAVNCESECTATRRLP